MLQKVLLGLILVMSMVPTADAKITIKNCKSDLTQKNIKKAIQFLAASIERVRTEKYSYTREAMAMNMVIDGEVPMYIAEENRYTIGLTDADVANLRSILYDEDVTIRCSTKAELACKMKQGGAYAAQGGHILYRLFYSGGTQDNTITLCSDLHEVTRGLGCQFYGAIAHELAHLADFAIDPNHNQTEKMNFEFSSDRYLLDKVYKFDKAITNSCYMSQDFYNKTVIDGVEYYTSKLSLSQ